MKEGKLVAADELAKQNQALEKANAMHGKAIAGCCQKIIDMTVKTGTIYLDLCKYIRKNEVAPKLVSEVMGNMGFNRQVISRVNKVANASDENWKQFEARLIGFNKVLDMERGSVAITAIAKESGVDESVVRSEMAELEETEESNPALIPPTEEETKAKFEKQLSSAVARALSACAALGIKKQFQIAGGNGYIFVCKIDRNHKPEPEAAK